MDKETSLSVAHLNKLFLEIKQNAPPIGSSQHANEQYETKIYNLLPLFCKMFTNNSSTTTTQLDIFERFCDPTSFAAMVSRLMVTEIRRRASNKTTESASMAIVEFLEISPTVVSSGGGSSSNGSGTDSRRRGWILLSTLNILVSFNSTHLVSVMTANSLASTLVKCLYLFFDLPPCSDDDEDNDKSADDKAITTTTATEPDYLSNRERRALLQKVFSQLLTRLCAAPSALTDLTKKDDLSLLFNAITSWCPEHNGVWRGTAADVIITMARHGNINVEYLHNKGCVGLLVENIQRIVELGSAASHQITTMFRTFITFLLEYVQSAVNNQVAVLLEDFSAAFGYQFFVDFALRLEQQLKEEETDAGGGDEPLAEMLSLAAQFTKVGVAPLKTRPLSVNQVFIIENFSLPKTPSGSSAGALTGAIRNLKAFNILSSLWARARTDRLQELILETVLSIYREEKANYFLLEGQNTLSSFAERLEERSGRVQATYYRLLEYVVFELNYVPCKELITVGMVLKNSPFTKQNQQPSESNEQQLKQSADSIVLCLRCLSRILKHNVIFRDVFREVGLLDILCSLYSAVIQGVTGSSNGNDQSPQQQPAMPSDDKHTELYHLILGELLELLIGVLAGPHAANCTIFHECAASKATFSLISQPATSLPAKALRKRAFTLVQQLVLSPVGEDSLSSLLVLLHRDQATMSSPAEAFSLKLSVLKSLLVVLSENHRIRALFRKIGGFVSVISVIVHMENCLNGAPYQIDPRRVWNLLRCVFATITTAMRFEPANSKYFAQEICSPSFTDSLRLLGCFKESLFAWRNSGGKKRKKNASASAAESDKGEGEEDSSHQQLHFDQLFLFPINELPPKLTPAGRQLSKAESAALLLRFLYEMAIDVLDRSSQPAVVASGSEDTASSTSFSLFNARPSLAPSPNQPPPLIIVYPCIVISMIHLIQFLPTGALCAYLLEKIISLLSLERNLQVMCDLGVIAELLSGAFAEIATEEAHPLHGQLQVIFERLASQHIQTKDLRAFLRLSNPLNCIPLDEIRPKTHLQTDRAIALSRIKSIISMATPREPVISNPFLSQPDPAISSLSSSLFDPPFIEFDMSQEGFSCIFIPSVAPISTVAPASGPSNLLTGAIVGNSDVPVSVIGGIGNGERAFPSQTGLSFTTWIYIHPRSYQSSTSSNSSSSSTGEDLQHNISILTLYRSNQANKEFTCLQAYIDPRDRSLTITTQEVPLFSGQQQQPTSATATNQTKMVGFDSDHNIRFPVPELFCDGQTMDGGGGGRWHHIVLVLNRTLLKNSTLNVYIDGRAKFLPTHPSNHHHGHQQQSSSYKLHYISSIVGGQPGIANTSPLYINAFIGTPPAHRRLPSSLLWKQGPCHLVEEPLQPSFVAYIFMLGPNYIGSFQAVNYLPGGSMAAGGSGGGGGGSSAASQLSQVVGGGQGHQSGQSHHLQQSIAEDRLIFGLNSRATSIMTLSKMRRVYSRFDCKQIAKIIGISSHENATPIYVLHNSAGHLCGPSRPLGGVLIGNVGARCFVPKQITLTFSDIGGAYPLLGLIANAASMEALYAGVKALVCVLRANVELQLEMERINGYQTMAMLLRRKRPHLNSHILHLLFELISSLNVRLLYQLSRTMYISSGGGASGSLDSSGSAAGGGGGGGGSSSSSSSFSSSGGHPANYRAFKELLVDSIDLWIQADLLKTVLEHLHEIIYESSAASSVLINPRSSFGFSGSSSGRLKTLSIAHLREMNLLGRLVNITREHQAVLAADERTMHLLLVLCFKLLNQSNRQKDILYFGQFIASLLPKPETVESSRKELDEDVEEEEEPSSDYTVTLRNSLLKVVLQLMSRNSSPNVNAAMAEELVRVLGFDWFLLFLGRGLNAETTTIGAVNLMLVLSNSTLFLRFKDGGGGGGHHYNGGWLKDANSFIANKGGLQLLGFNISTSSSSESSSHPENSGGQQKDQQSTSAGGHRQSRAINSIQKELLTLPGFQHLNWLLAAHCYKPKVYLILLQTMFGYYRPSSLTPATLEKIEQCTELTTDSLMRALMGGGGGGRNPKTFKSEEMVCKELAVAVFALLNAVFWSPPGGRHALKYREYPRVLMYFVRYLYSNNRDFRFYCQGNGDFLNALCRSVISNPLTGVETELTGHEGAQLVFDFILTIFVNVINTGHPSGGGSTSGGLSGSLSGLTNVATTALFSSQKPITTFEAILAGFAPCRQAQTRFLSLFMDTVISSQEYNSFHHPQHHQQQQLPPESATIILNFSHAFANIVLMMSTVVDRLWANAYVDDRKKVLECLVRILRVHAANESAKGAGQQSSSTSSASATFTKSLKSLTFQLSEVTLLYKSANRCLLYLISRSVDSMADRMFIFEVLQLLYQHRAVLITSKANSDAEFFICLTHCLLQLIDAEAISLASSANKSLGGGGNSRSGAVPSNSTWYVVPGERPSTPPITKSSGGSSAAAAETDEGALLIASVAKKIWEEIYSSKRALLEETMKVTLPLTTTAAQQRHPHFGLTAVAPDISQLRDLLYDSTLRFWHAYLDGEHQRQRRKLNSLSFDQQALGGGGGSGSGGTNIITEKLTNMNKFNNLVSKSAGGFVSKIVGGTSGVVGTAISSAVGTATGRKTDVFRTASSDLASSTTSSSSLLSSSSNSTALWTVMPRKDALYWTSIHASIIRDFVEHQVRQKRILDYHLKKYVLTEWLNYEYEFLTREKAIWGPTYGSRRLDKWMLDMTEGPNRMRKKMIRNEQFYTHYPYRPEFDAMDARMIKFKSPVSHDSKEYYRRVYSERYFHLDKLEGGGQQSFELEVTVDGVGGGGGTPVRSACNSTSSPKAGFGGDGRRTPLCSARVLRTKSSSDYDDNDGPLSAGDAFDGSASSDAFDLLSEYVDVNSSELEGAGGGPATPGGKQGSGANVKKEEGEQNDNEAILRLLEEGETISHMFRVARVQGLDSFEGLLLFGKEHFYLVDGFTLLKSREIRDIDSLPANLHDPIIPSTTPQPFSSSSSSSTAATRQVTKKVCSKFAYEDIKEVHKRRYLLQPIALELFSLDGRNSLVVFPRHLRNKVYSRFLSVAVHITDNAADSLMGQKRSANVETGGLLSNFIGETSVTQRWVRGEISNFQYLMNLNTLAGRSYNDLMQYPVFPWIVADYSSPELDLFNPASFRDLSKPMGAQTTERLEQFKKRFSEFDADTNMKGGDDLIQGPYHYGTFYSSAMIVASYLVRLEPFTQHFLRLQGGHFDLADRMFHSVGDAWLSAAKHNMADLKELIPEFFYLPEFLRNSNRFDFGAKQNGVKLDDVVLPPWAKDDPREFIRVHRAALECDYVSAHLHEWIDLIFGAKQNGPAAVEATNVFHHLFYEGNADIYNIDDPLKKNATIGFINNFGQIPKQLFKKPHPMKKVFSFGGAGSGGGGGGGSGTPLISSLSPSILLPSVNSMLSSGSGGGGSGSGGHSFGPAGSKVFIHYLDHLRPSLQPIKELKGAVGQIIQQEKATLLAVEQNKVLIPPTFNRYVAWGFADHSLRIGPYESDRALYVWESELFPPNGEILCSTVPNSRVIVTAGTNSVISVWRFKGRQALVLSLVQKLYGHTEAVTCLASSASYGIIVSGSRDRTCILWDLNRLVFIRQLGGGPTPLHGCPVAAIAINDLTGDIATCCSTMLYLWTINGELIASVNTLHVPVSAVPSPISNHSGGVRGNSSSGHHQQLNPTISQNCSQILCLAFSTYNEWDANNVILTGSSDGVVKLWTVAYVQEQVVVDCTATKESASASSSSSPSSSSDDEEGDEEEKGGGDELRKTSISLNPSADDIVRRLSIVSIKNESSNQTHDSDDSPEQEVKTGGAGGGGDSSEWDMLACTSAESAGISHSKSFNAEPAAGASGGGQAKKAMGNEQQPKSIANSLTVPTAGGAASTIRNSKSDTSLVDSFIVVGGGRGGKETAELKSGHRWTARLCFASKLTMHTAYERRDNREPAAITCLAVSRDHRTVFVGDARGRIFSWTVNESSSNSKGGGSGREGGPGHLADHWVRDEMASLCAGCNVKFSLTERRHHCRNCGQVYCARCSRYESAIVRLKIFKPVRVCQGCYAMLQQQQQQQQQTSQSGKR